MSQTFTDLSDTNVHWNGVEGPNGLDHVGFHKLEFEDGVRGKGVGLRLQWLPPKGPLIPVT